MTTTKIVRTFDLFDTLVGRRCVHSYKIFDAVESMVDCIGFSRGRVKAELMLGLGAYTIDDIYDKLAELLCISSAEVDKLKKAELEVEYANLYPIAENCRRVHPRDVIVSDMYLPYDFLAKVIKEICGLPFNSLVASSCGKRNRSVWPILTSKFEIREHLGDNDLTDYESPRSCGIPACITHVARRTDVEALLAESGFEPLSNLVREARLTTWENDSNRRRAQLAQIQTNFPFLFIASLELIELSCIRGWETILFSSRDAYLWSILFSEVSELMGLELNHRYFYTSRAAKSNPSNDYLSYFDALRGNRRAVIADVCGTGWSSRRLIERASGQLADLFLIHRCYAPDLFRRYETFGEIREKEEIYSLVHSGNNSVLEMLNCARHPMLIDVGAISGQFYPVFSDIDYDSELNDVIEVHHRAFLRAVSLIKKIGVAECNAMRDSSRKIVLESIYEKMGEYGNELAAHFDHQNREEDQVWRLLEESKSRLGESPNLTEIANLTGKEHSVEHLQRSRSPDRSVHLDRNNTGAMD